MSLQASGHLTHARRPPPPGPAGSSGSPTQETRVRDLDARAARHAPCLAEELWDGFVVAVAERFRPGPAWGTSEREAVRVHVFSDAILTPESVIVMDDVLDTHASLTTVVEVVRASKPE